jgi:hypothetical protein
MPMKRFLVLLTAAPFGLAACSQPEVLVEAQIPQADGEAPMALADLPVRLLPYDRDAIFDSLEAAYEQPEPPIPPEILQAQQQVQQAQAEWRETEERWATVRDSLSTLSEQLQQMQQRGLRGTPQYGQLFERFGRLEAEERQVNQTTRAAFQRFDQMQRATLTRADSIRLAQEAWAERAFADFPAVVEARLLESGVEEAADTTGPSGFAQLRVPEGRWWVYARFLLPYEELYWNVPIEVTGDSVHIRLTPENADRRPVM